jgi:uncharacterized zinc-type alcohol dehydrogenase-like protein
MAKTEKIRGWAAHGAGQKLVPYEYDPGRLGSDEAEISVEYCGICHSDLSVLNNDWGNSIYPYVPGHEIIGSVIALGENAKGLTIGQKVGVGWFAGSDMHCPQCISGDHHLCSNTIATIIGHNGGFAERVRAQWQWVFKLPEGLDAGATGPLMCGGITVFAPFLNHGIRPTDRVGIVGIGGLGHMALKFARAWGCEVTAFTHSKSKFEEAMALGADHVVSSQDRDAILELAGRLDMLLITVNVPLDWSALITTLAPKGRMHIVGVVPEAIPVAVFDLIVGQRSISGSPTGSPAQISKMLEFAARHGIAPQVEHFPMSNVNDAIAHLQAGKARYRIVLDADFD